MIDRTLAIRMYSIAQKNIEQIQFRIDPQNRSGESAVAECAFAEQFSAIGRIACSLILAQPASTAVDRVSLRHQLNRGFAENAFPLVLAAADHHLRIDCQVFCR